ncbi:MAG: hypothetical protein K2X08_03220, partial [Chlamydiales bacterium]|nr:hypothetical protein [Chlamydiales bacterium]
RDAFCNPKNDPVEAQDLGPRLVEELIKAGFHVGITWDGANLSDIAAVVSWDVNDQILRNLRSYPRERCFLLAYEPPCVAPIFYTEVVKKHFGKIFVIPQDWVDNDTYIKFHCPMPPIRWQRAQNPLPFLEKKLCAFMNGNKFFGAHPDELYTERRRLVSFFSTKVGEFDLYGRGWEGFSCWKGTVPHEGLAKVETLKQYKFTIAYENMKGAGYIGDKLFPVMTSLSVPVYLGATDIIDYVPKSSFIDRRDFVSNEELYDFLKNMDQKTHESYLASALDFLDHNPKRKWFTVEYFIQQLLGQLCK